MFGPPFFNKYLELIGKTAIWRGWALIYSVFHRFGQAKFAYGHSIFNLSQFFDTTPAASKNNAHYESSQNWLENNHLDILI